MRNFFLILFLIFLCIIRFFPSIENKTSQNLKKSEKEVSTSAPQESFSDETQHIYSPPEDRTDDITNTDHEWIYIN